MNPHERIPVLPVQTLASRTQLSIRRCGSEQLLANGYNRGQSVGERPSRLWLFSPPLIMSVLGSMVFIARSTFTANGHLYFALFDDAMISMRYARNLADGHGLLWNPGQPAVEGYTNFLWTLWMAALHLLPVTEPKIALVVMLTGVVLLAANVIIVRKIAERLSHGSPTVVAVSMWLTALYYPLVYWTLRGMEVGLVTLEISTAALLALRLRDTPGYKTLAMLAATLSLGIVTRPDVVVPCAVISAFALWTIQASWRRVAAIVLVGAAAATLGAHTVFRVLYYGAAFPNTYYLKLEGAALTSRITRGLLGLFIFDALQLMVPTALATGYLVYHRRKDGRGNGELLLAGMFVALCAYSVYVGGDAWDDLQYTNRYVTPAMPGLLILSSMAIDSIVRTCHDRRSLAAVSGLFVLASVMTMTLPLSVQSVQGTPLDGSMRIARAVLVLAPVPVLPLLFVATRTRNRRGAEVLSSTSFPQPFVAVVLTVAAFVGINGQSISWWLSHNAAYVEDDTWATRYGLALRQATGEDATIAVTWAGAIPYFSHRRTIDLLGKSDSFIATRPRDAHIAFSPGHDKWDYEYSIGRLRPDVVAQVWHASQSDLRAIERWHYTSAAPWVFIRADTAKVNRTAVANIACIVMDNDPFVLGAVHRWPVQDATDVGSRSCR